MKSALLTVMNAWKQILHKYPKHLLLLLCIFSRLPQLLSNQLLLDPDECVSATMAEYLMQGKDWSLFFWGQNYGLSILENLVIIPFYLLFGIKTLSVKLAMLSLWTSGVLLLYSCLLRIGNGNRSRALFFTALFVLSPSWAVWSMKARGGYLSGFVLSMLLIRLLYRKQLKISHWLVAGILLQIIYQSHALWLIGLLPLTVYQLWTRATRKEGLLLLSGCAIPGILFMIYKHNLAQSYRIILGLPEAKFFSWMLTRFPDRLLQSFHGTYYFGNVYTPGKFSLIASYLPAAILLFLVLAAIRLSISRPRQNALFITSTLFIWGFLAFNMILWNLDSRYLLSVPVFTTISLMIYCRRFDSLKMLILPGTLFLLVGAASLFGFRKFEFKENRKRDLLAAIDYLEEKNIRYCFSEECMLPWHLSFYSQKKLVARMPYRPERNPAFAAEVDSAFFAGAHYALVGVAEEAGIPRRPNELRFGSIKVEIDADKKLIEEQFFHKKTK